MAFEQWSVRIKHACGSLALLTLLFAAFHATPSLASPMLDLGYVQVTNVRETSFTLSWITDTPSNGVARCYNTSGTLVQTASDPATATTTHYVLMTGFTPLTLYRCEVESGGVVMNNNGAFYSVTTGGTLSIPAPGSTVYGQVFLIDGVTLANGAIVYLRLVDANGSGSPGRSQWVSSQQAGGFWFIDLNSIRTMDSNAYFSYTPGVDQLEFWAQGGSAGTWGLPLLPETVMTIPSTLPAALPNAVLDDIPLAVTLESFYARAQPNGIQVVWQTASEIDNQGFNLYRAIDPTNPQELLGFVPSRAPGGAQGYTYEWLDTNVASGETYYYWLESIDLSGTTTLHGPVSATYQVPTAVDVTGLAAQPIESAAPGLRILAVSVLLGGVAYGLRRRSRQIKTE